MLKRFLVLFLTLATLCGSMALAKPVTNGSVIYQATPITSEEEILSRIEHGITDDIKIKANCILSTDTIQDGFGNDVTISVKSVKTTSQKIKVVLKEDGTKTEEYIANSIATVAIQPLSSGTEEFWDYDGTGYNAKLYYSISYSLDYLNSFPVYKVTNFKGKLEKLDSSIVLSRIELIENIYGEKYSVPISSGYIGIDGYSSTAYANSPSNNTYYVHTNLSSHYWRLLDVYSHINCRVVGYFTRYGSSWSAEVNWIREG